MGLLYCFDDYGQDDKLGLYAASRSPWMISPTQCRRRTSRISNRLMSYSRTLPSSFYRISASEVLEHFMLLDILSDHLLICCIFFGSFLPHVPFLVILSFSASFCKKSYRYLLGLGWDSALTVRKGLIF